jgi:hypothetical protein
MKPQGGQTSTIDLGVTGSDKPEGPARPGAKTPQQPTPFSQKARPMTALPAATSLKTAQAARTGSPRGAPSEMRDTLAWADNGASPGLAPPSPRRRPATTTISRQPVGQATCTARTTLDPTMRHEYNRQPGGKQQLRRGVAGTPSHATGSAGSKRDARRAACFWLAQLR